MAKIHIGKGIRDTAKEKGLSQGQVGTLIDDIQQNVGNDYKKESLTVARLLLYSKALDKNFLSYYYEEEPLKTYREQEFAELQSKINELHEKLKHVEQTLKTKQDIINAQSELIETQRELIAAKENEIIHLKGK